MKNDKVIQVSQIEFVATKSLFHINMKSVIHFSGE